VTSFIRRCLAASALAAVAFAGASSAAERRVIVAVWRQPGAETTEVAASVRSLLPEFREKLPKSVTINVLWDGSLPGGAGS